ncbi:MAG: PorV/PorQ family protein [Elusimicrobia bacterium]|nr:PorV/PorQ family protein [Elusimicrobiota bacterium]
MDISPRALGMAGSFAALADDVYSMNYNPGGLGQLYVPEVSAMYLSGFEDSKLNYIGIGSPLPFLGMSKTAKPVAGLSLAFSGSGDFTHRVINPDGTITSRNLKAESDTVLTFSYGEKFYSGEVNLEGYMAKLDQFFGASVKYVKSELLGYSGKAVAFDAGYLVIEPNLGLSLGASVSNVGGGIKYISEKNPLPVIFRTGISYQKPTIMDQTLILAVGGDIYANESVSTLKCGLEYHFQEILNLRLGYKLKDDNKGLTMGLGVQHEGFSMDFGMTLSNEVFNTTQIAVSYKFANFKIKEYKRQKRFKEPEKKESEQIKKPSRTEQQRRKEPEKKKKEEFFWIY